MKIIRQMFNLLTQHLRKFGLMQTLCFDQQVWGAKSVMDLIQFGSKFMLAEANKGGTMYTVWLGSHDQKPYAISVDVTGHATTPNLGVVPATTPKYDSSRIGDCSAWTYPPKLSCAQAQAALIKAGITDAWTFCRLSKTVDSPQANPYYDFVLSKGGTAQVDADTGTVTHNPPV